MLDGHLLSERYRIKQRIGGGGMANVYLARDIILDRDVAIKVLRPEFASDPEFIERFDREAQAATSLSHPNIVNIYDVGDEDDILYIVMEYVDGMTLKEYILEHGPLDVATALDIMEQLTSAIHHAHMNGLVHRDIKPQNILIDRRGKIKVTDFGIAVALSATALTQTNSILGSVHYLSPEQARGGKATKKSDIYSLGIVFYELLTGKVPFSGHSPVSIALKHLQDETPSVREFNSDIPQSVENIILKATAKDPFHRYQSAAEMEEAIKRALDPDVLNEPKFTPPVEPGEETKAIPIITDLPEQFPEEDHEETTMIHQPKKTPEPEKKEKPKKKRRRKILLVVSIVIFVLIGSILAAFLLSSPKDVVIPDLVGYEYEEAKEILEELNLTVNKELIHSDEVEEGHVVKTDPGAGRTVKEKSTVDVYVSEGKEKVAFPDFVGQNISQVERLLADEYKEVRYYEVVSDKPIGEIVNQIQPAPGTEVIPSETVVIFEVSGGPKKIALGNLIGLTVEQAKDYAERNKLKLEVSQDYSDTIEKGKISKQDPAPNTEVTEGSTIKVTESLGKKELPPRQQEVTFTVPFRPEPDADGNVPTEQRVQIYVGDMNNNISEVFREDVIRGDTEYTLTLVIKEGMTAEYRVVRDGKELMHQKVPY